MDRNRILELALEGLYRQKAGIDADIEEIQAELTGTGSAVPQTMLVPSAGTPKGRQRTPGTEGPGAKDAGDLEETEGSSSGKTSN